MVMSLKKYPLFMLAVKMVITVVYIQFNPYAVIHCNNNIIQRSNIDRCYNTTYYFRFVFFYKIPFIVVRINFAIPTLII